MASSFSGVYPTASDLQVLTPLFRVCWHQSWVVLSITNCGQRMRKCMLCWIAEIKYELRSFGNSSGQLSRDPNSKKKKRTISDDDNNNNKKSVRSQESVRIASFAHYQDFCLSSPYVSSSLSFIFSQTLFQRNVSETVDRASSLMNSVEWHILTYDCKLRIKQGTYSLTPYVWENATVFVSLELVNGPTKRPKPIFAGTQLTLLSKTSCYVIIMNLLKLRSLS